MCPCGMCPGVTTLGNQTREGLAQSKKYFSEVDRIRRRNIQSSKGTLVVAIEVQPVARMNRSWVPALEDIVWVRPASAARTSTAYCHHICMKYNTQQLNLKRERYEIDK